jgi:hypothetical protein
MAFPELSGSNSLLILLLIMWSTWTTLGRRVLTGASR